MATARRGTREASRRAAARDRLAAAAAAPQSPWERLSLVVSELRLVNAKRARLVRERDAIVDELHQAGVNWGRLSRLAGVSRQALMKRYPLSDIQLPRD